MIPDKASLQANAWEIPCPRCDAGPDTDCNGFLLNGRYHRERHQAALAHQDSKRTWTVKQFAPQVHHRRDGHLWPRIGSPWEGRDPSAAPKADRGTRYLNNVRRKSRP